MDEIKIFREWVEAASRQPLEIGDLREAVRRRIAEAEAGASLPTPTIYPLFRDMSFRVASAAMVTVVAGLGLGYYSLVGMTSEWSLNSAYSYYELLNGFSSFWGVF